MARVKYGGIVTDLSGSVGGSTFQRSSFGSSLRSKPNPIRGRSSSQGNIRHLMSLLHASWRGLSVEQRTAWDRFINFSNQTIRRDRNVLISGHALFIKYNLAKLLIGDEIIVDLVYISMPQTPLPDGAIGRDPMAMGWAFESGYNPAAMFFILKLSSPRLASNSFSQAGLRWIPCAIDGEAGIDLFPGYPPIFGAVPPENVYLHYSLQWFSRLAPIMNAPITGSIITVSY